LGNDYSNYAQESSVEIYRPFEAELDYLQYKLENVDTTLSYTQVELDFVFGRLFELSDRRQQYIQMWEAYWQYDIYDNAEQLQIFYEKWNVLQEDVEAYLLLFSYISETLEVELEYIDVALYLLYELNASGTEQAHLLKARYYWLQEEINKLTYVSIEHTPSGSVPYENAPDVLEGGERDYEYEDRDDENEKDYSYDCTYNDNRNEEYNDDGSYSDILVSSGSPTIWGSIASIFSPLSASASSTTPGGIDVMIPSTPQPPPATSFQLEAQEAELLKITLQLEAYIQSLNVMHDLASRFNALHALIKENLYAIAAWQDLDWGNFEISQPPVSDASPFEIFSRIYTAQTEIENLLSDYLESEEAAYLATALFSMRNRALEAFAAEKSNAGIRRVSAVNDVLAEIPSHLYTQLNDILENYSSYVFTLALEILPTQYQAEEDLSGLGFFIDLQAPAQYMTYAADTVAATNLQTYSVTQLSDCTLRIFLSDIPSYGTIITVQAVLAPYPPCIISTAVYLYEYQNPDYIVRHVIDIAPAYMEIQPMMLMIDQTWRLDWPPAWTPAPSPEHTGQRTGVLGVNHIGGTLSRNAGNWNDIAGPFGMLYSTLLGGLAVGWPSTTVGNITMGWVPVNADTLVINVTNDIGITIPLTARVPSGRTVVLRGVVSDNNHSPQQRTISLNSFLPDLFDGTLFNVAVGGTLILDNIILCGGDPSFIGDVASVGRRGGVTVEGVGFLNFGGSPGRLYVGRNSEIRNAIAGDGGGVNLQGGGSITDPQGGVLTTHPTSNIHRNLARSDGGGVFGNNGSTMRLAGTIENNSAGGGMLQWLPGIVMPSSGDGRGGGVWGGTGSRIFVAENPPPVFNLPPPRIQYNEANFGGGIFIRGAGNAITNWLNPDSTLIISGGYISDNRANDSRVLWELVTMGAEAGMGGGIFASGSTNVELRGGVIENNVAQGFDFGGGLDLGRPQRGFGGGIFIGDRSRLYMRDGIIRGNTAVYGGGVMLQDVERIADLFTPTVVFEMHGGIIENNRAIPHRGVVINRGGEGGGVRVDRTSVFRMFDGTIRGNSATGSTVGGSPGGMPGSANGASGTSGGGVSIGFNSWMYGLYLQDAGRMYMYGGVVENNTALLGGGISVCGGRIILGIGAAPGRLFFRGGEIRNNHATRDGGGIWVRRDSRVYMGGHPAPLLTGNTANGFGGGSWHGFRSHLGIGGNPISITNNHAGQDGGGMFISSTTYGDPLPGGAYNIRSINIEPNIHFSGNTAGNGWFIPAVNAGTFASSRIPYMAGNSNTLHNEGVQHSLNNYDINYRGVRPFWFIKHDDAGNPLSGAVFRMERYENGTWVPIRTLPSRPERPGPPYGDFYATSRSSDGFVGSWHVTHNGVYRLIEIHAPGEFFTPVGHWTVTWVGGPPQANNSLTTVVNGQFVVTPQGGNPPFHTGAAPGARPGQRRAYIVPNFHEPQPFEFSFFKRGTDSIPLSNAGFRLYRKNVNATCDNCEYDDCLYWEVVRESIRSDAYGIVEFELSPIGFYRLREYFAPSGYHAPAGHWFIYWCQDTQSLVSRGQNPEMPDFIRQYVPCTAEWCACHLPSIYLCWYCYNCDACRSPGDGEDYDDYGDECIRRCTCNPCIYECVCPGDDPCEDTGICLDNCIVRCAECDHPYCNVIQPCNNHYIYILYNYPGDGIASLYLYKIEYGDLVSRLPDAEFRLYRRCTPNSYDECDCGCDDCDDDCDPPWHYVRTVTSNTEGQVKLDLSDGEYRLVETSAPDGFKTPDGYWLIHWCATANGFVIEADSNFNPPVIREYYYCEYCPEDPEGCEDCYYRILLPNHLLVTVYFEFYKATHDVNLQLWSQSGWLESVLLPDAHFALLRYNGPGSPPVDAIVTESMTGDGDGQWTLVETAISTGSIGNPIRFPVTVCGHYQLVETHAPDGWQRPSGQWRITAVETPADSGEFIFEIVGIGSPPAFLTRPHYCESDEYCECVIHFVGNRPVFDLPMSGSIGSHSFYVAGLLLLFVTLGFGTYVIIKKQNKRAFKV